jgi:UDP-N-acetyl-D-mannosaminuronic acid transferase (WecB/TagA/CpsF family)
MKAQFNRNHCRTYSEPAIPSWVSEMGLEWLYMLLAKSEAWKSTARLS